MSIQSDHFNFPPRHWLPSFKKGSVLMQTFYLPPWRVPILIAMSVFLFNFFSPVDILAMSDADGQKGGANTATPVEQKPMNFGAGMAAPAPGISSNGYVFELLFGADTVLNNPNYGTLAGVINNGNGTYTEIPGGPDVPYNFGTGPMWAVRGGKMVTEDLLIYLTLQQTYFSHNTHTIIGLGGSYYLPTLGKTALRPYLNAIFGASDNTFTGTNAQTGYSWMLGAGALYPFSSTWGVFVEADLAYESAPTGITTNIGAPPGTISSVSNVWDIPVLIGIRYAF